jgi:ABC-type sugar transport system ATPase subunit/ribose/xylose/arabinose/galactoside ABC-type transport system permease subunit
MQDKNFQNQSDVIAEQTTTAVPNAPCLMMTGIVKSFTGVMALKDVSFECRPGEIHALVGENGSGKSTLIKVAAGVLVPDVGTVQISGTTLRGGDPRESRRHGLMTAYQDTSLIGDLTVAENIALSFHCQGEPAPENLKSLLARFDLPFAPRDTVKSLGPGGRQMLEVVRAMSHSPSVLALDEPTAALDMQTAKRLQDLLMRARDEGLAIVYVSHRLQEVRRLADRLTVIRDGVIQGTYAQMNWEVEEIVELMVGARIDLEFPKRAPLEPSSAPLLDVRDLQGTGVGPVSISVQPGEIVGIAGAEGNGQRNLLRAMIGIQRESGEVRLGGVKVAAANPAGSLRAGIMIESGDRAAEAVFPSLSVLDNATFQLGRSAGPFGLVSPRRLLSSLQSVTRELGIAAASPYQPISALSGGNQQKVVLSRPSLRRPKVLIVDEPTQGVDAKARLDIYRLLSKAADDGVGILVNSSDSSELAGLCDRVYVMSDGVVIDEVRGELDEADLVRRFVSNSGKLEQGAGPSTGRFDRLARAFASPRVPVAVLVLLIVLLSIFTDSRQNSFLSQSNINNMLVTGMPLLCAAIGQQFALLAGEFDISIGATMTVAVVVSSFVLTTLSAGSLGVELLVVLGIGLGVGLFNAFLTQVLKVNPLVATIGTLGILSGIAVILRPQPGGVIDFTLGVDLARGIGPVPFGFIALAVVALLLDVGLARTGWGLSIRGVGLKPESSQRIGVRVNRIKTIGYILAALGAAVGGLFLGSQVGTGTNDAALTFALPTFAACFLGGATLTGGRGTFTGAGLGVILLTMVSNGTQLLGASYELSQVLYGAILLIAIAVYAGAERRAHLM